MVTDVADADLIAQAWNGPREPERAQRRLQHHERRHLLAATTPSPSSPTICRWRLGPAGTFEIIAELKKLLTAVARHGSEIRLSAPEEFEGSVRRIAGVGGAWTAPVAPSDVVALMAWPARSRSARQGSIMHRYGPDDPAKYIRRYQELG